MKISRFLSAFLILALGHGIANASSYKYKRVGSDLPAETHVDSGIAMMGGGPDLKEAFRWLCGKGNGGDFLIIRQATVANTITTRG